MGIALADIGLAALFLAFAAAIYAVVVSILAAQKHSDAMTISARNAALACFPLMIVSVGALWIALLTEQYQINYVRSTTDPLTPTFYRVTALWGSQEGSLLFWSLIMAGFVAAALLINWKRERRLMPYVIAYSMATLAFFLGLSLIYENPFERVWLVDNPEQGTTEVVDTLLIPPDARAPGADRLQANARGLNPLLRHFGMIIHPPMLYLGFVGFTIPFAFAMAALASGDLSANWIKATRRWTLVAWLFLSLGLILGGRWAYDVLGWGGYWGWDPVENAAFLPWLIGTAFLHSVMIQEKRGMLKVWNMVLIIFTFSAVMFGTFATRSGLIESVHSFARSEIGLPMFLFWSGITLVSVVMLIWRWSQGKLREEHHNTRLLSRESMFVLNNVIFVLLALAIFWGSFGAPILSELLADTEITLGTAYFMQVTPPLFLAMYVLMGVAPVTAWGATSIARLGRALLIPLIGMLGVTAFLILTGTTQPAALIGYSAVSLAGFVAVYEIFRGTSARMRARHESALQAAIALFMRSRRRYGGYIVHLGIAIIGIGVIGSTVFQEQRERTLDVGEVMPVAYGYEMRFDGYRSGLFADDGRVMDIAEVTVIRAGRELGTLRPRIDRFPDGMNMTIAGARSTLENDFYVLLWPTGDTTGITFRVYVNPLVNLIWWGGLVLIAGTIISAWPNEAAAVRVRERAAIGAQMRATS